MSLSCIAAKIIGNDGSDSRRYNASARAPAGLCAPSINTSTVVAWPCHCRNSRRAGHPLEGRHPRGHGHPQRSSGIEHLECTRSGHGVVNLVAPAQPKRERRPYAHRRRERQRRQAARDRGSRRHAVWGIDER